MQNPTEIQAEIKSLDAVKEKPWDGPNGPIWFVQGTFADGSTFSLGHQSIERAKDRHAEFSALLGKPGAFEVIPKGEYQGKPKYGLKSWPGKPEPRPFTAAGGTRGTFQVRYRDTKEGFEEEGDRIHRSVALQQAVALQAHLPNPSWDSVKGMADNFYGWLVGPQKGPASVQQIEAQTQHQTQPAQRELATPVAAPVSSHQKPNCPNCGALDSVRWDNKKEEYYCWTKLDTELFDLANNIKKGCGHKWKKDLPQMQADLGIPKKKTATDQYLELIDEAVKNKQAERIAYNGRICELIVDSHAAGSVSDDDIQVLQQALNAARKALSSAAELDRWHAERVAQVQAREQQGGGHGP